MKFQQVYPIPSQLRVTDTYTIITPLFMTKHPWLDDSRPDSSLHHPQPVNCASFLGLWPGRRLRARLLRQWHCSRWFAH